jgi:phosphatidylserine decarboxylase
MATITTPDEALTRAPITNIQPGGGFCFELERAWGKIRRSNLRRFRPRYVERMQGARQGQCPNCPHDIIDSRDLKLYRNVCGYWFRPEDDRFRYRDRLRLARPGMAELVLSSTACGLLVAASILAGISVHSGFFAALIVVVPLWIFLVSFFRDPERKIPDDPRAVVSPADGTVSEIETVVDADFPQGTALRISIFLSVFNVHVNRTPRGGKILDVRYFPGRFLDARNPRCGVCNEQLWIDMEDGVHERHIRVKQVAGAIARRIVCWLKPGDTVEAGQRLGMIKFGSRTDLLLPASEDVGILVKKGDRVKGGSTILARW